jgi:hypothetical protein
MVVQSSVHAGLRWKFFPILATVDPARRQIFADEALGLAIAEGAVGEKGSEGAPAGGARTRPYARIEPPAADRPKQLDTSTPSSRLQRID